jgi:uncharacterized protein
MQLSAAMAPVSQSERISSMDVLRGAALLGIALMNILFSGLPLAADFNPKLSGGATGLNLAMFALQFVFFDGKMRGIFSMMFGAGSYLLISRAVGRGAGSEAVEVYYRRTLWLMLFGIIHAYFIWHGDILYAYALLGLVLVPFHRLKSKSLLIVAGLFIAAMTAQSIYQGVEFQKTYKLAMEAEKAAAAKKPLTEEQKEAQTSWEEQRKYFNPSEADLKKEIAMYSGSYFHLVAERAKVVRRWHSGPFYAGGWDMFTMMLIGIAFAKSGVLSAERSSRFYRWMLWIGYGIGIPVGAVSFFLAYRQNFEPLQTVFTFSTYQLARVSMTMGHVAVMLLICRRGWFAGLRQRLAAVGQTAFSNYILHSLIYGFVFYGYGFRLYNKLQRYELYYVVVAMWMVSLLVSPAWLRHFRYGPLEWCWRSLTYWKRQPVRLAAEKEAAPELHAAAEAGSAG